MWPGPWPPWFCHLCIITLCIVGVSYSRVSCWDTTWWSAQLSTIKGTVCMFHSHYLILSLIVQDMVDLSTGEDIHKLVDLLQAVSKSNIYFVKKILIFLPLF